MIDLQVVVRAMLDGKLKHSELLKVLSEHDTIDNIETKEDGLTIKETSYPSKQTTLIIIGEANTMSLNELAEKIDKLGGKILNLIEY